MNAAQTPSQHAGLNHASVKHHGQFAILRKLASWQTWIRSIRLWSRWQRIEGWTWLAALVLLGVALVMVHVRASVVRGQTPGDSLPAHITWYGSTGSPTYSGIWPYDGSAGCSFDVPLYSTFRLPDGRVVTCLDRGNDGFMQPLHLDVFCDYGWNACTFGIPGAANWTVPVAVTVLSWGK